jgi:hypothetical protein
VIEAKEKKTLSAKGRRNKGRDGRYKFRLLLESRDWVVSTTTEGKGGEDLLANDPDGVVWAVEVKDVKLIDPKHLVQAREQAKKRKARWFLANHLPGYGNSWLVQRQGYLPCVWHANCKTPEGDENE